MSTVRRVVVCDDARDLVRMLEVALGAEPDLEVVATAANGLEGVERCREHRPDVVVLDVAMPVMDGLTALPLVREASPETRVVLYSAFDSAEMRSEAEALGADAYVRKGTTIGDLVAAIRGTG
jgi:DNA-binding NarL/FixJ family response regulator